MVFLGDTSFANYIKNEFEALGSLWKILSLDSLKTIGWGGGICKMKLNWPVAIICSIGNVELEIQQCLLGIFSNVEVGDVNLATSKVELATWQSGKVN
jgi:hypothetical protein